MDNNTDAKRILLASPPVDWRRQPGRSSITWLSTVQQDLKQHYLMLPEAADLAQKRPLWRMISTYGATQSWLASQKRRRRYYYLERVGWFLCRTNMKQNLFTTCSLHDLWWRLWAIIQVHLSGRQVHHDVCRSYCVLLRSLRVACQKRRRRCMCVCARVCSL